MSEKVKPKGSQGTSGGAAAASGVNFQESVAALAMVHAVLELNDYSILGIAEDFVLQSVHLESAHAVDDVVLVGLEGRALIQAKRTVALSDKVSSEYSSALQQFVTHHFTARAQGDRYVLATSIRSSGRIIFDLRKLTESVRLNVNGLRENPLTGAESEVVRKTNKLLAHHISTVLGRNALQSEVDDVFSSIWVLPLDLDPGGRDELTAITLLRSRSKVAPKLIWDAITSLAKTLMGQRSSVDCEGLQDRIGRYLMPIEHRKTVEDEFRFQVSQVNKIAAGKEVVLFDQFLEAEGLTIAELNRFAEDGSSRIRFKGDNCTLLDGSSHKYYFRSATIAGATRFFEANKARFLNSKVALIPYSGSDDLDEGSWALARRDLLESQMQSKAAVFRCLICGDPISEDRALLVEVDEDDVPHDVGYAHTRCHRPSLRVLGELQSELFARYVALQDFDYQSWILSSKYGTGILFSTTPPQPLVVIGWKPGSPKALRGNYCIRFALDDGSSYYMTDRGKVQRFGVDEIDDALASVNQKLDAGWKARNPFCVSPSHSIFGNYSTISPMLKSGERLLRCKEAMSAEFSVAIDTAYSSPRNFYAPLAVLLDRESGSPIIVQDTIFLVSEPLDLALLLDNWREVGFELPDYSVAIVENDADFDTLVIKYRQLGLQILIDPIFDLRGILIKGYDLQSLEEFLERREEN